MVRTIAVGRLTAMDLPIVGGVDGSEPSLRAVDRAADEATQHAVPLRIVHAYRWDRYEGAALAREIDRPSASVTPDDILVAAGRRARRHHPDLAVTFEAVAEEAEYVLLCEARHASTVVVGTRGHGEVSVRAPSGPGHPHAPAPLRLPGRRRARHGVTTPSSHTTGGTVPRRDQGRTATSQGPSAHPAGHRARRGWKAHRTAHGKTTG